LSNQRVLIFCGESHVHYSNKYFVDLKDRLLKMNKIFLLSISLLFFSCQDQKEQKQERVIFTTGFFMNPAQPRFGIEIKADTLFYCEEIIDSIGTYNYYYCIHNIDELDKLRERFKSSFASRIPAQDIPDATLCQVDIISENEIIKETFYLVMLEHFRSDIIKEMIKLKDCDLKSIEYHEFPKDLLYSQMPIPPSIR